VAAGINTVHLSYVREKTGHALVGARQWVPEQDIASPVQSLVTGLPLDLRFRTKGQLAIGVLGGAYVGGHASVLGVDERVSVAYRCSFAKYAAAFFRNAFSASSSRLRHSSSRMRSWSGMPAGTGCPAIFFRYALTQNPRVVSLMPISLATCAMGSELSTTRLAACSLNSGE
jgi:hypothetical protein